MTAVSERLDAIEARHGAWYSGDDKTAEWPDDIDFVVSYEHDRDSTPRTRAMAHEITREDVPYLLDLARKQQAALDAARLVHAPRTEGSDETYCRHCYVPPYGHAPYPCPTIQAMEAKL